MAEATQHDQLREEFNRWAEAGRGEGMEQDHLPIVLPVLDRMRLQPDDNVLDVGCGAGWLSSLLAEQVPEGRVVGIDVSDEMIRHARRRNARLENVMFVVGEAEQIPWDADFFTHAISVESAYYWPDPARAAAEIFRVLREGGSAWVADQLLPRQPALASVGRHSHGARAAAIRRRVGRAAPRRGLRGRRARADTRPYAGAGNLLGPLVPRRRAAARFPRGGRAAGPWRQTPTVTQPVGSWKFAGFGSSRGAAVPAPPSYPASGHSEPGRQLLANGGEGSAFVSDVVWAFSDGPRSSRCCRSKKWSVMPAM